MRSSFVKTMLIRSAELEFLSLVECHICNWEITSITDCENVYLDVMSENGIDPNCFRSNDRSFVSKLITENISHVKIVMQHQGQ